MRSKRNLITIRIEPAVRKQFQNYCKTHDTTMSQELRRCIKQQLGIIKHAPSSDSNTES